MFLFVVLFLVVLLGVQRRNIDDKQCNIFTGWYISIVSISIISTSSSILPSKKTDAYLHFLLIISIEDKGR